jgi:endonuclease III
METNWTKSFEPLLKKYAKKPHPLEYKSRYQLMIMVILSARDSDKHINQVAPPFFEAYPTLEKLSGAAPEDLFKYLSSVVNFDNKIKWILNIAQTLGKDDNIPKTMEDLIKLSGIGRKSANVIMRESGDKAEGIIVDLHVVRVAPRIGVATGTNPEKIEKQLMEKFPKEIWGEVGMAISFLGREICRPTNPKCVACPMNPVCVYFKQMVV